MKALYKINKKYKIPLAILAFLIGLVGLLIPIIPGVVLIAMSVILVKDYFKPREIIEGMKDVAEKAKEVAEDVGEELEDVIKKIKPQRSIKRMDNFIKKIRREFTKK